MLKLNKHENPKKIELITSTGCNLNCKYCFLHKNNTYNIENQKTLQAIKDGSFINNILKICNIYKYDRENVTDIAFWGGEPTIHFLEMENFFKELINIFPNISKIDYSTNFIEWEKNLIFFKYLDKIINHNTFIDLQISFDGPDWISEQTRGYKANIIENNIISFISEINKIYFKNLQIDINLKATMSWPIFKELCSNKELLENYIQYALYLEKKYNELNLNKNIHFYTESMLGGGLESPYEYTIQDGIDIAAYARQIDQWNLSQKYGRDVNLPLLFFGLDFKHQANLFNYNLEKMNCGKVTSCPSIRYDGTSVLCNSGIMNDNEQNLLWLKDNDLKEYEKLKRSTILAKSPSLTDKEEMIKKFNHIQFIHDNVSSFNTGILCSLLYELAYAGQVDRVYLENPSMIFNHVNSYFSSKMGCYYYSLIETGSVFVPVSSFMKIVGNGLIQYYDEKVRNQEKYD